MDVPISKPKKTVPLSRPGERRTSPHGWRIRKSAKLKFPDPFGGFISGDYWVSSELTFWSRELVMWVERGFEATCYARFEDAEADAFFLATQYMESVIDVAEW